MTYKTRLFLILWLTGMTGVLSILLIDFAALFTKLVLPPEVVVPEMTPGFFALSILQPAVLLFFAVLIGVAWASKVGLSSPVAEALAGGRGLSQALTPQVIPGIVGGVAGGIAIVATAGMSKLLLSTEVLARLAGVSNVLPLPTRLLYGGITEELLLRWGLMTLIVWITWRVFQKQVGKPRPVFIVSAIVVSSVIFGIGHLPIAHFLVPDAPFIFTLYVIAANSIFGIIAGYLYWKKGLESAIIAHMMAHIVMHSANYIGAYY